MNSDNDYKKYKIKVSSMIELNEYDNFGMELLLQPNMVLSIINQIPTGNVPILYTCGDLKRYKLFELCLNSIFHFGEIMLNDKNKDNGKCIDKNVRNDFISRYLNVFGGHGTIDPHRIWGIDTGTFVDTKPLRKNDYRYKLVEIIFTSEYFNALNLQHHIQFTQGVKLIK